MHLLLGINSFFREVPSAKKTKFYDFRFNRFSFKEVSRRENSLQHRRRLNGVQSPRLNAWSMRRRAHFRLESRRRQWYFLRKTVDFGFVELNKGQKWQDCERSESDFQNGRVNSFLDNFISSSGEDIFESCDSINVLSMVQVVDFIW